MSKARQKGTAFETALIEPLSEVWPEIKRTGSAAYEKGDFEYTAKYLIEAKAQKDIDLAGFLDQAKKAASKIGAIPVVIIKRRNKSIKEAYVVFELNDWLEILKNERRD